MLGRKPEEIIVDQPIADITKTLYQQGAELSIKNKTLGLLGKLYEIGTIQIEPSKFALQISDIIRAELGFEVVGVFIVNQKEMSLNKFYVTESQKVHEILETGGYTLSTLKIEDLISKPGLTDIEKVGTLYSTASVDLIDNGSLERPELEKLVAEAGLISFIIQPLKSQGGIVGVILMALNRPYDSLSRFELESIASIGKVVGILLDKSLLHEELKVANEGQENLIHIMNHQIKGYLAKGRNIFAEMLEDKEYGLTEKARPMIDEGLKSLTEGVDFVQQVLKGSSAQSGKLVYTMSQINFRSVAYVATEEQGELAKTKGLTIDFKSDAEEYKIVGDEVQLREAVKNLINNSINYTEKGGIKVDIVRKGNKVLLSVKDTGIGLGKDDKARLFQSGGRGKDSLKYNINSTGYGLAFVKGVVEAHKGRVWAESAGLGKGSHFYIELPLA